MLTAFRLPVLILLAAFALASPSPEAATCVGNHPCKACKNCTQCRYCHRLGGYCGVCSKPAPE